MVGIDRVVVVRVGLAQEGMSVLVVISRSPQIPNGGLSQVGTYARVATVVLQFFV